MQMLLVMQMQVAVSKYTINENKGEKVRVIILQLLFFYSSFAVGNDILDMGSCEVNIPEGFSKSKAPGMYYQDKDLGAGYLFLENMNALEAKEKYSRESYKLKHEKVINNLTIQIFVYSFEGNPQEFVMGLISSDYKTVMVANMPNKFLEEFAMSCKP